LPFAVGILAFLFAALFTPARRVWRCANYFACTRF
jgi:hypothetical protein